jgi:hypothetical protein
MKWILGILVAALFALPSGAGADVARGEVVVYDSVSTTRTHWVDLDSSIYVDQYTMLRTRPSEFVVLLQAIQRYANSDTIYVRVDGWHNGLPFALGATASGADSLVLKPAFAAAIGDSAGDYRRIQVPAQVDSLRVRVIDEHTGGAWTRMVLRVLGVDKP